MRQEYYYQRMAKREQPAHCFMLDGFEAITPEFPVLNLGGCELSDLFFRLHLDHPSIFYVEGFNYRYADSSQYIQLILQYMFEKKEIKEMRLALESRTNRLTQQAGGLSPEEKGRYIHDFIRISVTYDKLKKQYSHEIISPSQQGVGVCKGIAKTMKILCDRIGMECIIAIGQADLEQGIRYRHVWNLIKLKNTWYHPDATFDNSLGRYGQKRFDYYSLDDKMMFRDHQPLVHGMPACPDGSRFHYKGNHLSLTKTENVFGHIKAVLRKKQPCFALHWRGGALNREVLERIVWTVSGAAREKGKYTRLSVNYRQIVMETAALRNRLQETTYREEASEGELDGREK